MRILFFQRNIRFFLLLLFFDLSLPASVRAQPSKQIGCYLEACIRMALSNHPLLNAGDARKSAASMLLAARKAEWMPTLTLESSVGYFLGKHITPFSAIIGELTDEGVLQRDTEGSYYRSLLRAEIPLFKDKTFFLGSVPHAVRQAQSGLAREEWENQALRSDVSLKVAEAYVQVLKNQKAVAAHEEIVTFHAEDYAASQAKFKQDLISKNDLLMEEVRWGESKRNLSVFQFRLRRSQESLSAAMGLDHTYEVRIPDVGEFPDPLRSIEELVILAQKGNPLVKAQQFKVEETAEDVETVASELYPAVSMNVHYGAANDLPTAFNSPTNDQWMATVDMNVPLFDGTVIRKKVAFARARLEEEKARLRAFESDLEQQVRDLYLQAQEQEEGMRLLKKQIQQAEEALKLNQALFRQQLVSSFTVHDTKTILLKLELDQGNAVYDQYLNRLKLALLIGEKIPEETRGSTLIEGFRDTGSAP